MVYIPCSPRALCIRNLHKKAQFAQRAGFYADIFTLQRRPGRMGAVLLRPGRAAYTCRAVGHAASARSGSASRHDTVDGNAPMRDEQEAKLRLVVETAREIWG
jgi:hypothetical protein